MDCVEVILELSDGSAGVYKNASWSTANTIMSIAANPTVIERIIINTKDQLTLF